MIGRLEGTSEKVCRFCNEKKATMDFRKHPQFKDKRYPICKVCENGWKEVQERRQDV